MKIGSLFSGYGGLDLAVEKLFGAKVAWVVEWDKAPSKVLAHHYPDAPNYHDVSKVNWAEVEPVDILTGGFPCQDLSMAGKRQGLKEGTRSGLWLEYANAIEQLKPKYVIIENVRGLLSGKANSDVEQCPWCMGTTDDEPTMRALGTVLASLAELGYDAQWHMLRAADAGAAHNRERVFILAHANDTNKLG